MPGQSVTLPEALPRTHYFLTVSRGSGMRTFVLRSVVVHLLAVLVPLVVLVGVGGALVLVFHDDLLAGLMQRQADMQYAYEDRIEAMRQDLERETTRARADGTRLDGRLQDIASREARLEARAAAVAALAGEAGASASSSAARTPALPAEITGRVPAPPAAALGYAAPDKPHPLFEPAARGPGPGRSASPEDHAEGPDPSRLPVADRLRAADLALDRIERGQAGALARIGAVAREKAVRIRGLIEEAGLSPDRYLSRPAAPGVGGPFVPLPDGPDGGFGRAVAELRGSVAAAAQLGRALDRIPLSAPLTGHPQVSSPFGARLDPFLGRPALHTGVDLRDGYGADIRATGAGRVAFAGVAGGYGNMVEIDHGNGVSTRYAHMGQIAVSEGQSVGRGAVVGHVGATGRATGPHLHYEVRIDGEPVDPTRFLAGADRLAQIQN